MGLAIFSIAFYSAYLLFLVGLLISALFARDPKKQKKRQDLLVEVPLFFWKYAY